MHYFIDGYNLLFRLMHAHDNLQSQRESIIYDLNKKISLVKLEVSIVFDSAFQMGDRTRTHFNELEILFTAQGETADEYILDEIKNLEHPQQETVVTSDKQLAWKVRHHSAHTESVEEFMQWLNKAYKNKLRQRKKDQAVSHFSSSSLSHAPPPDSLPKAQLPPPPKDLAPPLNPPKNIPLEACMDYYQQIFEAEWKEILQQEKQIKQNASSSIKRHPRKPLRFQDPFQTPSLPEPKTSTDMERWLKAFEKRLLDDLDFKKQEE